MQIGWVVYSMHYYQDLLVPIVIIIISAMLMKLVTTGWKSYCSIKSAGFSLLKIEQLQLIMFHMKNRDTLIEQSLKILIDK